METTSLLRGLNAAQREAVSSPAQTLAILAGPGSGKTHTLTSRTAWLLQHEKFQPCNVIVATFTVKAAAEMKERIGKLLGNGLESQLILGTFHSISCRYLRKYGSLIGLERGFGIADTADTNAILRRIIKRHRLNIEPKIARARISKAKATGSDGAKSKPAPKTIEAQEFEICFAEYEEALRRSNTLDFDDLLLRTVDLLQKHPSCVGNVEAVLIDEFQDTNLVQFDLMRLFASARKRVTIVGDPDQSIYGFRSAETKNFHRMLRQYPETVTIPLEENYRSSGCILSAALEVIQQDETRISKHLLPTHSVGTRPVLRKHATAWAEAEWIVREIKRVLALTGELMDLDDIAILLRSASLSRVIESALGTAGIAYRMVGGFKFYDRVEVKLILDYLTVIHNPQSNDTMARILNVPSRKLGDTTVKALLEEADSAQKSLWKLVLDSVQGRQAAKTKLTKPADRGLASFVDVILTSQQKLAASPNSPKHLMEHLIKKIGLEDYLAKTYEDDFDSRWANVEELLSQAAEYSSDDQAQDDFLPQLDSVAQVDLSTMLSKFLANIALASAVDIAEEQANKKQQVTISTIHAAKGLEWPLVFIPAAYAGSIPHSRAEDNDEERRLLYVAMTRAQALLYMSWPTQNSRTENTTLSPFLSAQSLKPFLEKQGPSLVERMTVNSIAHILKRKTPSQEIIDARMRELGTLEDNVALLGDDEEVENNGDDHWDGQPRFTRGQRPPKRQRIGDFGNNTSMTSLTPCATTMGQFGAPQLTTGGGGFVTAGSQYKILSEQSLNTTAEKGQSRHDAKDATSTKSKSRSKLTAKSNQGTLTNFFAPASERKPSTEIPPVPSRQRSSASSKSVTSFMSHVNTAAKEKAEDPILPSLANHRLRSAPAPTKPHRVHDDDQAPDGSYNFLSSPPKPEKNEAEAKADVPTVSPFTCHAPTMHATTIMGLTTIGNLGLNPVRRSLGVRRSVTGWMPKNTPFKPPFS